MCILAKQIHLGGEIIVMFIACVFISMAWLLREHHGLAGFLGILGAFFLFVGLVCIASRLTEKKTEKVVSTPDQEVDLKDREASPSY